MFRRRMETLPPDAFSALPVKLGPSRIFINTDDQVRMVDSPEKPFCLHVTHSDRYNERRREVIEDDLRGMILDRLSALELKQIYLPDFVSSKPNKPHASILISQPELLNQCKRVVMLIGDSDQDLGVLSWDLTRALGVSEGSLCAFVKRTRQALDKPKTASDDENPTESIPTGLVVANIGQLLYSYRQGKSMTTRSWSGQSRKSTVHPAIGIREENRVPGHTSPYEHVKTIFDTILHNPNKVASDAEVFVIAISDGTEAVLKLLHEDFSKYGTKIAAMALIQSGWSNVNVRDPRVKTFLHRRARQWRFSHQSSDPKTCISVPNGYLSHAEKELPKDACASTTSNDDWGQAETPLCPTFAGGEYSRAESVFANVSVQQAVLSFLSTVSQDSAKFENGAMDVHSISGDTDQDDHSLPQLTDTSLAEEQPDYTEPGFLQIQAAEQELLTLEKALLACPEADLQLKAGRMRLVQKVEATRQVIRRLKLDSPLQQEPNNNA